MSIHLPATVRAWDGNGHESGDGVACATALKEELTALPTGSLPLDEGTSQGGYVDDRGVVVTVLRVCGDAAAVQARIGVFFTEIIASCGCGDEPQATNAYCELEVRIDRQTAAAVFTIST